MKGFRFQLLFMFSITAGVFFSGCSSDAIKLAELNKGDTKYSIRIRDVKEDLFLTLRWHREITNDIAWHRNFLFSAYLSKEIACLEELEKGMTNAPDFNTVYAEYSERKRLHELSANGEKLLTKQMEASPKEIARVSVIFLKADPAQNADSKRLKALEIVGGLLKAGNNIQEFKKAVSAYSEDEISSKKEGNLGYVSEEMLDENLAEAIFQARQKGLIQAPVKTDKGYFIVFITDPVQTKTIKDISGMVGPEKYKLLTFTAAQSIKQQNSKVLFSFDTNNNGIIIAGKHYSQEFIPDEAVLFQVFGHSYSWDESKRLILAYAPDTDLKKNLAAALNDLLNLAFDLEAEKRSGQEKPIDTGARDPSIVKEIALDKVRRELLDEFRTKIQPAITPEVLKTYYENHKQLAYKEIDGRKVALSYQDLEKEIYDVVNEESWQNFTRAWNEKMKENYSIVYYDQGIKELMEIERQFVAQHMPAAGPNLALNRPAAASSYLTLSNNFDKAFDGNEDTVWFSSTNAGPQWIAVDLGGTKPISKVVLRWGPLFPPSFLVEVSLDGKKWDTAYIVKECTGGVNEVRLEKIKVRFVRIGSSDNKGFSLREFEVY